MVKITINIEKKHILFFVFALTCVVLLGAGMAYNYNFPAPTGFAPAVFGHTADEMMIHIKNSSGSWNTKPLQLAIYDNDTFGGFWQLGSGGIRYSGPNVTAGDFCTSGGKCLSSSAGGPWQVNGNNVYYNVAGGNIGIGTSSPVQRLNVIGNINATGDICTDLAGGKCLSSSAGGPWQVNGNNVYYNVAGGNVGIGTNIPLRPLSIQGTGANSELITLMNSTGLPRFHINLLNNGFNLAETGGAADGRLFIQGGTGNVGIGVINPVSKLELFNNTWIMLNAVAGGAAGINFYETGAKTSASVQYGGKIFYDETSDTFNIVTRENNIDRYGISISRINGNVGIGTNSPSSKLDVGGGIRVTGSANFEATVSMSGPLSIGISCISNPTLCVGGNSEIRDLAVLGYLQIPRSVSPVSTCTIARYGQVYYDTDQARLCICADDAVIAGDQPVWRRSDSYGTACT